MIKKTMISIIILAGLIFSAINVSAYDTTLTIDDETNDIVKGDNEGNTWENYSYPNVDIVELKGVQTGKKVEITLKLEQTGEIEDSPLTTVYMIVLITTSEDGGYMATYAGNISKLDETITSPIFIEDGAGNSINSTSFSGVGTNTLSFSFNLKNTNEKTICLGAVVAKESGNYSYGDKVPENFEEILGGNLYPNAGGSYNATVDETLQLSGSIEEGDPSDYNWLWIIDDTSIEIQGQNPTYVFKVKDIYMGRLYVYDGKGNWGLDVFQVNVSAKSSGGGNGGNDQPGFELILVVAAVAIALILFRKKKK